MIGTLALIGKRRRVTDLADAARRLRPGWRNGRFTLRRPHGLSLLYEHRWAMLGVVASVNPRRVLLLKANRLRRIDQIIDYFGGLAPKVAPARGAIARPMAGGRA